MAKNILIAANLTTGANVSSKSTYTGVESLWLQAGI